MSIDWTTFTGAWARVRPGPYAFVYAALTSDGFPERICDSSVIDIGKEAFWMGTSKIVENEPWLLEVIPVKSDWNWPMMEDGQSVDCWNVIELCCICCIVTRDPDMPPMVPSRALKTLNCAFPCGAGRNNTSPKTGSNPIAICRPRRLRSRILYHLSYAAFFAVKARITSPERSSGNSSSAEMPLGYFSASSRIASVSCSVGWVRSHHSR